MKEKNELRCVFLIFLRIIDSLRERFAYGKTRHGYERRVSDIGAAVAVIEEAGACDFSALAGAVKKITFKIRRYRTSTEYLPVHKLRHSQGISTGAFGYAPMMTDEDGFSAEFIARGGRIHA